MENEITNEQEVVENENVEVENEQEQQEQTETFTREELAAYVKNEIEKQKKEEEEARKKAKEDAKLTQKQREERDLKEAQMKLKVDRLNFDIAQYRASLNLAEDKILDKLINVQNYVNSTDALKDAKSFIDTYKLAIDTAYNKAKTEAEDSFNKIKMQGQEIFEGVTKVDTKQKIENFDDFWNSLND